MHPRTKVKLSQTRKALLLPPPILRAREAVVERASESKSSSCQKTQASSGLDLAILTTLFTPPSLPSPRGGSIALKSRLKMLPPREAFAGPAS